MQLKLDGLIILLSGLLSLTRAKNEKNEEVEWLCPRARPCGWYPRRVIPIPMIPVMPPMVEEMTVTETQMEVTTAPCSETPTSSCAGTPIELPTSEKASSVAQTSPCGEAPTSEKASSVAPTMESVSPVTVTVTETTLNTVMMTETAVMTMTQVMQLPPQTIAVPMPTTETVMMTETVPVPVPTTIVNEITETETETETETTTYVVSSVETMIVPYVSVSTICVTVTETCMQIVTVPLCPLPSPTVEARKPCVTSKVVMKKPPCLPGAKTPTTKTRKRVMGESESEDYGEDEGEGDGEGEQQPPTNEGNQGQDNQGQSDQGQGQDNQGQGDGGQDDGGQGGEAKGHDKNKARKPRRTHRAKGHKSLQGEKMPTTPQVPLGEQKGKMIMN